MKNFGTILKTPLKWIICSIVIILGLSIFFILQYNKASDSYAWFNGQGENDAYVFPEYKGKKPMEWNDIIKFNQIPEETLKSMATEGLIETCINYPLFATGIIISSESLYAGFQKTCQDFNGLKELYQRKDAPTKLVDMFTSIDLKKLQHTKSPAFLYKYICYMIAKDEIILNICSDDIEQLIKALKSQEKFINKNVVKFSQYDPLFVKFRIYKRLYPQFNNLYESNFKLQAFVDTGVWINITENECELLMKQVDTIFNE